MKRLLRILQAFLSIKSLVIIFKCFFKPYLDYGDVCYDQMFNRLFQKRLEPIQYNTALAITGAGRRSYLFVCLFIYLFIYLSSIHKRESSKEKLYQELGL